MSTELKQRTKSFALRRLELIAENGMLPAAKVDPLHAEAIELTAIMASSRVTATRNKK